MYNFVTWYYTEAFGSTAANRTVAYGSSMRVYTAQMQFVRIHCTDSFHALIYTDISCIKCADHHVYFERLDKLITQGVPYDYKSIMHYECFAATKNYHHVMRPLTLEVTPQDLGSAALPTDYDYLHINLLYCPGI